MSTPSREYMSFAGTVANVFNHDWGKVQDRIAAGWPFLNHIPDDAWKPMTALAVDRWESWPRNWVRGCREVYAIHKVEAKIERAVTDCEYCNGVGYFTGSKWVDVRPGMTVRYAHTFRCNGCRNWVGKLGTKIPALYPLEAIQEGYHVSVGPKPIPDDAALKPLPELLESIGKRVNPRNDRPAVIPYREERSAWDNY